MSKSRRNRSGKNKRKLNNTYLPGDIEKTDLQKGSVVIGLGEVYAAPSKDKQSHECKININPEAVKRSFNEFKKVVKSKLTKTITDFYRKDTNQFSALDLQWKENEYGEKVEAGWKETVTKGRNRENITLDFDINVIPSRLSATTFTYIYQFELSFYDGEYRAHMVDNLQKFNACLRQFTNDLYEIYTQAIPKGYKTPQKINVTEILELCNSYGIKTIQERAPIISAENGKYNLTQVDISQLTQNTLYRHASISRHMEDGSLKEDNKYDKAIFDRYCKGQSDAQIAFHQFLLENAKNHPFRHLIKGIAAVGTGILYGPGYGLGPIGSTIFTKLNSLLTLGSSLATNTKDTTDALDLLGRAISKITGKKDIRKHFQTGSFFNENSSKRVTDDILSQGVIPTTDIGSYIFSLITGNAINSTINKGNGIIGGISQGTHYAATQLKVELDSLDVPKAMNDIDPIELLLPDIIDYLSKKIKIELEGGGFLKFGKVQDASYTTGDDYSRDHMPGAWVGGEPLHNKNNNKKHGKRR